jgi:hypothetical protein
VTFKLDIQVEVVQNRRGSTTVSSKIRLLYTEEVVTSPKFDSLTTGD